MEKGRRALSRAISGMDLDPALESYLPIVEIAGNSRVHIENYKCIQSYTQNAVCVCVGFGIIQILGRSLLIAKVSTDSVSIDGIIESIQLETRS